jgi:GT2 family glycosyltransferase
MDVSVVIVTYNSAECIGSCLASVRAQVGVEWEAIVVDNASGDKTAEVVRGLGPGVQLLANPDNRGFGRGCNQGFAASRGRFVYLLNPDALVAQPDGLARLCRAMGEHPQWGMAGTRVISPDGHPTEPSLVYPGQSRARHDFARLPGRIAWVVGASMFVRRSVYSALNGFDPEFFLYSEETDFCLRLRKLGHEIGFVPEVEIRHIGGASEQEDDPYSMWTRRTRGVQLFWRKHYSPEDAARLVRRDMVRARFRSWLNGLLACVQGRKSAVWRKQRRYQAIWQASSEFLAADRVRRG